MLRSRMRSEFQIPDHTRIKAFTVTPLNLKVAPADDEFDYAGPDPIRSQRIGCSR